MTKDFLYARIQELCDKFETAFGIHGGIFDEVLEDFAPIYEDLKTLKEGLRFDIKTKGEK